MTKLTSITIPELRKSIILGDLNFNYTAIGFDVIRRYNNIRSIENDDFNFTIKVDNGIIEPMHNKELSDLLNLSDEYKGSGVQHHLIEKINNLKLVIEYKNQ